MYQQVYRIVIGLGLNGDFKCSGCIVKNELDEYKSDEMKERQEWTTKTMFYDLKIKIHPFMYNRGLFKIKQDFYLSG